MEYSSCTPPVAMMPKERKAVRGGREGRMDGGRERREEGKERDGWRKETQV